MFRLPRQVLQHQTSSWLALAAALPVLPVLMLSMLLPASGHADSVRDAERLLRVADAEAKFEYRAQRQAQRIIHNYAIIIRRNTDYRLPVPVRQQIADCYRQAYRWENFAAGFARILAENLSGEELELLINFHRNLGLPPNKIEAFKDTVAKVGLIHEQSAAFIFSSSPGCVDRDAEIILEHLREQNIALRPL